MPKIGLMLLLLLLPANLPADTGLSTIRRDSSLLQLREFDADLLHSMANDTEFNYPRAGLVNAADSWSFWDWLSDILDRFYPDDAPISFEELMAYAVVVAAAILVVVLLSRSSVSGLLSGRSDQSQIAYRVAVDDIREMSLDALIQEAIEERSFRKAVRLLYLKCLRELTDRKLINWQREKTNLDYARELRHSAFASDFREVSRLFEIVWYGELNISSEQFQRLQAHFELFSARLSEGT